MEVILIRVLQFMLSISLLVLLHEGGHFFFSKLFGVRVEKFYLFFDPWFHLFEWKPKNSDTTYGLGWLPLGGYCKIAGMIDESFDTEQMKQPAQPWEFRSKPAWQRLLIMVGGVLVNFILALFIYAMVLFHWGQDYVASKDMTLGMKFNTEAKQYGFRDHDILLGTEKREFKTFNIDMVQDLAEARECYIIRDGKKMTIHLPGNINLLQMVKKSPVFVKPFVNADVDSVMPGSPADKIGLHKGDRITAINGKQVDSYNEFTDEIAALTEKLKDCKTTQDSMKYRKVQIAWTRMGESVKATASDSLLAAQADTATTVLTADMKLGFMVQNYPPSYRVTHISYGFLESLPAGVAYGWNVLAGYVDQMKYVFSSDGVKSLGGFGAIGSLFPPYWDWHAFWMMTAWLSIILAFMNILPIPALDGGHVLFLLYEIITRRKPSEQFLIRAEYVGFVILILLLIVANLNDVLRWLGYM